MTKHFLGVLYGGLTRQIVKQIAERKAFAECSPEQKRKAFPAKYLLFEQDRSKKIMEKLNAIINQIDDKKERKRNE